jgi:hypothetical protein
MKKGPTIFTIPSFSYRRNILKDEYEEKEREISIPF